MRSARRGLGRILAAFVLAAAVAGCGPGGVHPHPGQSLEGTRSLGDLVAGAGASPVHIVYIHGMAAQAPGTSLPFRQRLCAYVGDGCRYDAKASERHYIAFGPRPPARYLGEPVWRNDADWKASRPFVDRFVFRRDHGGAIVVDELNWYPLLFPLKCRYLLMPEVELSGADAAHLRLCATRDADGHAWLDAATVEAALAAKHPYAGGARINRALKAQLVNWGIADAVTSVGPMQAFVHDAMDGAFAYAETFEGAKAGDQTFAVISESLGSFAVLDAFNSGRAPSVRRVMESTYDIYFFANQFRLLELTRLQGMPPATEGGPVPMPSLSPISALREWAASPLGLRPPPGPPPKTGAMQPNPMVRQVIAFNDPSDALTFEVPQLPGAKVVNVYDRNETSWLGLFADPAKAHLGHAENPGVLKLLFEKRAAH